MEHVPVPNTFFNFVFTPKLSKSAGLFLCEYLPFPKCKVLGKNLDIFWKSLFIHEGRWFSLLCYSFLLKFSQGHLCGSCGSHSVYHTGSRASGMF